MKRLFKVLTIAVLSLVMVIAVAVPVGFSLFEKKPEPKKPVRQIEHALAIDTGASSADKSKKGGAIYVDEGGNYTMNGGTITGKNNTYGGAVFVSKNATFTMTGGTISGCRAKYGGAIYVASGGTCYINGGKITGNKAELAPAIFVEDGGKVIQSNNPQIEDNVVGKFYEIGSEVVLGAATGTTKLKTIEFGTYPQDYVGSTMNSTLESWYNSQKPSIVKTYTIRDYVWNSYTYTDGNIYARGTEHATGSPPAYKDGTAIGSGTAWFKVSPITWYILNFDAWNSGQEDLELFSELILTGNIYFNASNSDGNSWETSYIRNFCKGEFYNTVFDDSEKEMMKDSTIGNNVTDDYYLATSDQSGTPTTDKIYLKSCYEMSISPFTGEDLRYASGSDFAFANYLSFSSSTSYVTRYSNHTGSYWLRSAGSGASWACSVSYRGVRDLIYPVSSSYRGVRPALHLDL